MIRPVIASDGPCDILAGVNVDYDVSTPSATPTFSPSNFAIWDVSKWDDSGVWGGDLQIRTDWQTCFGIGFALSAHIQGASLGSRLRWVQRIISSVWRRALICTDKVLIGPWVADRCGMVWTPENSQAIGWIQSDGTITAGVIYQDFTGKSVMAHISCENPIVPGFLFVIFDYPFNQIGVEQIIAPIVESNTKSIGLARRMGFQPVCRIPDYRADGGLIFFALKRKHCRFLRGKYGQKCKRSSGA
jgi:hypothetical protein